MIAKPLLAIYPPSLPQCLRGSWPSAVILENGVLKSLCTRNRVGLIVVCEWVAPQHNVLTSQMGHPRRNNSIIHLVVFGQLTSLRLRFQIFFVHLPFLHLCPAGDAIACRAILTARKHNQLSRFIRLPRASAEIRQWSTDKPRLNISLLACRVRRMEPGTNSLCPATTIATLAQHPKGAIFTARNGLPVAINQSTTRLNLTDIAPPPPFFPPFKPVHSDSICARMAAPSHSFPLFPLGAVFRLQVPDQGNP